MNEDYAPQDVHTLTVAEIFVGEDKTTQNWPGGSCDNKKKECSKNKKEKELKPPNGPWCWRKKRVFQIIRERKRKSIHENK